MYKVGIECHNLENKRWGIGRHLAKLLEEIARREKETKLAAEFQFYLYFKERIPDDPFLQNPIFIKRVLKWRWPRRAFFNLFFHLLLPWAYRRDHLQVMFFPSFILPIFFRGKSLVVLTNDVHYEFTVGSLPWRYRWGYRLFSHWAARRATVLTTYTPYAKRAITQLFKIRPERIVVNQLGIDHRYFQPLPSGQKENYLLSVGQAFPRRRGREIIEAFALLAPKFPTLHLVLVGPDKYQPPFLDALIFQINQRLGTERIFRYDYLSDDQKLLKLYQQARLFIYLSSSEALGLPPLEALAAGTSSLVKDNELNREIYQDYAFYARDETDPEMIAADLEKALQDTVQTQKILAHCQAVIAPFSWSQHTENFLNQMRVLCQRS